MPEKTLVLYRKMKHNDPTGPRYFVTQYVYDEETGEIVLEQELAMFRYENEALSYVTYHQEALTK